jgi:hypothetical protein
MKMIIDNKQKIVQTKEVIVSNMGQEKVMLSIANGKYYNLGELGGDIWEKIREPKPINQLISELINVYDIYQVKCDKDVLSFLQHILLYELIMVN